MLIREAHVPWLGDLELGTSMSPGCWPVSAGSVFCITVYAPHTRVLFAPFALTPDGMALSLVWFIVAVIQESSTEKMKVL